MKELLADKKYVHHLGTYAFWAGEAGNIEYATCSLSLKSQNLLLLRGQAWKLGDVLGLGREEEKRETTDSMEEIQKELERYPMWDKTKYYCSVYDYVMLGLLYYCESSEPVNEEGEDYRTAQEILRHYGVKRRLRSIS
ncbi:MAG: hypothetical protein ABUK14_07515 [Desulfobacteria bacterium]|jgi:hypothetical protein